MDIYKDVSERFAELFKSHSGLNVWQWAEKNVILTNKVTPRPGPYRSEWCPYVRAPQEDFTNPDVRDIVLCWAARSTKTETMLNCIRYSIAEDPQAMMIVMPSRDNARTISESRLQPSIDDSPALASQKPSNPDKYRYLEMHFKKCSLTLTGANSAANLKSRGVTILMLDEIDTWKKSTKKETGALQQVLERTKDRWNRKHLITSTPTIEDGQIWIEFKLGDQRYYFMPCPHCREYQTLKLNQVKWDPEAKTESGEWDLEKVKNSTFYECEKCKGRIEDSHKPEMLRKGEWRPTAKNKEPGRRSYHLNSLYPEWIPFSEVAIMFLQSKVSREELQRFVNSWMAEPFYEFGDAKEFQDIIDKKMAPVRIESVPQDHIVLITADVQINHLWFVARAWNKAKESIQLDFGMIPGFEELLMIGRKWGATCGFVDSAYRPQVVLEWCGAHPGWVPTLGSPLLYTPMRWSKIPIDGGVMKGKEIQTLRYRANDWKELLNDRIHGKREKWEINGTPSEVYKKQMAGERRVEKRGPRGTTIIEWVRVGANHGWDCEVMQTVGFEAIRPMVFDVKQVSSEPPKMKTSEEIEMTNRREEVAGGLWNSRDQVW